MPVAVPRKQLVKRKPPTPAFQAPLMTEPAAEPERPVEHNGIPVVREEALANLPNAPFRITKLHLSDGTQAHACRECLFTADTRGEVMLHRNQMHGAKYGKKRPKVEFPEEKDLFDPVLPPRGEVPAPSNPLEMTVGEFLALAPTLAAMGDLIDRLEEERDAARAERDAVQITKEMQHKIDVYESNQQDILDYRLKLHKQANYEELKAEVLELRAWKKKIVAKLSALGFHLNEEE